jgi:uncharacterized protein
METIDYLIPSGNETLSCSIDYADENTVPSVISLHGGGPSNKKSTKYIAEALQKSGKTVIRFDYSGQGQSTGDMKKSSLNKRIKETINILNYFDVNSPLTVIGSSMGGYIACCMAEYYEIENLILFCPAAYSYKAKDAEFGYGFSKIIRTKDSYMDSDIGQLLKTFNGSSLFITGSEDEVIPEPVINLYCNVLSKSRIFEKLIIEDCPHPIHKWSENKPDIRNTIVDKVLRFISSSDKMKGKT